MSEEQQTQSSEQSDDKSSAAERAKEKADAWDDAHEKMAEMEKEDDPPSDLSEWPDDEAKYVTYGGGEGDHGYEEGPEKKLGPSSLRRFEDGSIEIDGEKVDNPDDYKSDDPIEGASQTASGDDDDSGESGDSADESAESGESGESGD